MLVALAALLIVLAGAGVIIWWYEQQNRRVALWKAFAEKNGGTYRTVDASGLDPSKQRIEIRRHRLTIILETWVYSGGRHNTYPITSCHCNFLHTTQPELVLEMVPENLIEKIKKKFGSQDIETPFENLNKAFFIQSPTPDLVQQLFTQETAQILTKHYAQASLYADGQRIELREERARNAHDELQQVVDLIEGLARRDIKAEEIFDATPRHAYRKTE